MINKRIAEMPEPLSRIALAILTGMGLAIGFYIIKKKFKLAS